MVSQKEKIVSQPHFLDFEIPKLQDGPKPPIVQKWSYDNPYKWPYAMGICSGTFIWRPFSSRLVTPNMIEIRDSYPKCPIWYGFSSFRDSCDWTVDSNGRHGKEKIFGNLKMRTLNL